jgi:dATP pyrophosphohydrolase
MARAPFQVAAFPVRILSDYQRQYAVFRRRVEGYWQSIAGGGEGPLEAIQRESFEEAAIPMDSEWIALQTQTSVPILHFQNRDHWDASILVIPVYYFGVISSSDDIRLSSEHLEYEWVTQEQAQIRLKWDSDRTALWELDQRLHGSIARSG